MSQDWWAKAVLAIGLILVARVAFAQVYGWRAVFGCVLLIWSGWLLRGLGR